MFSVVIVIAIVVIVVLLVFVKLGIEQYHENHPLNKHFDWDSYTISDDWIRC